MSSNLFSAMMALALSAGLATVTFAASGTSSDKPASPDTGMTSGAGSPSGSQSDTTTSKKPKKSGESSMGIGQPGSGSEQDQPAAGLGGQKDSPVRGQEKSPEGKSQFGESGSGQGGGGGIGTQGQGRSSQ
jgi:hypothetical protein